MGASAEISKESLGGPDPHILISLERMEPESLKVKCKLKR